jgi:hypothetical protein
LSGRIDDVFSAGMGSEGRGLCDGATIDACFNGKAELDDVLGIDPDPADPDGRALGKGKAMAMVQRV